MAYIVHYKDKILLLTYSRALPLQILQEMIKNLNFHELIIANNKIQLYLHFNYLGIVIHDDYIAI